MATDDVIIVMNRKSVRIVSAICVRVCRDDATAIRATVVVAYLRGWLQRIHNNTELDSRLSDLIYMGRGRHSLSLHRNGMEDEPPLLH